MQKICIITVQFLAINIPGRYMAWYMADASATIRSLSLRFKYFIRSCKFTESILEHAAYDSILYPIGYIIP